MRAVVLAPGPSLSLLDEMPADDVSIAIKRAAFYFPQCQWVAILDTPVLHAIDDQIPAGAKLLTRAEYRPKHTSRAGLDVEALEKWCPVPKIAEFTATAALVLAGFLGAERVDVYGADWTQQPDFDGHVDPETMMARHPDRWKREGKIWGDIVLWLSHRGCEVVRHTPAYL